MLDVFIEWSSVITHTVCICVLFLFLIYSLFSLDWPAYQWTEIGDEVATALADPTVFKNFKTLE